MQVIYFAVDRIKFSIFGEKEKLFDRMENLIKIFYLDRVGSYGDYINYKCGYFFASFNKEESNLLIEFYPEFIRLNNLISVQDCFQALINILTLKDEDDAYTFAYKLNRCDFCIDYIGEFQKFNNGSFISYERGVGNNTTIFFKDEGSEQFGFTSYIMPVAKPNNLYWVIRRYEKSKEIRFNSKEEIYPDIYLNQNVIRLEISLSKPFFKSYSKERSVDIAESLAVKVLKRILDTQGDIEELLKILNCEVELPSIDTHVKRYFHHLELAILNKIKTKIDDLTAPYYADSFPVRKELLRKIYIELVRSLESPDKRKIKYYEKRILDDIKQ